MMIRSILLGLALLTGISPAIAQVPNFPQTVPSDTFVGRIQPGSGPTEALPIASLLARVISPNSIPNSVLAKAGAATLKGNPTAALANVQDFTIQGLANRNAPNANLDRLLIFDNAAGLFKYVTPGAIAAAATAGVSSIIGQTGGLGCGQVVACVTPEQYGALCNGTGDDGPAIQAAINSSTFVRVILTPSCTYRVVTGLTINKNGVVIEGAGRHVSVIDYEPGVDGTLFTVGDGITTLGSAQLRNFSIVSTDTTFTKVGLKLIDVSETVVSNISCGRTNLTGGLWSGGAGSTCLQTNGRDTTVFEKLLLYADLPIAMNLNPAIYISTDHFVFRDITLVANGFACITAGDGIVMTNTTFEGYQSWNRCTYGFIANDTLSVQNWNNVTFRNVRSEQTVNAAAFSFFISVAAGNRLVGLTIENSQLDPGMKGILLRNVQNVTVQNVDFPCSTAPVAFDLNASNDYLRIINSHFETSCTLVNSGGGGDMVLQWAASYPSTASGTIPADAIYGKVQVVPPMFANAFGIPKIVGTGVAPGAGLGRLEFTAGTTLGTCKLIAYAGTSVTPTTLLDNIGNGC